MNKFNNRFLKSCFLFTIFFLIFVFFLGTMDVQAGSIPKFDSEDVPFPRVSGEVIYADNETFSQIILEHQGGTIVLTEDIHLLTSSGYIEDVLWQTEIPTVVQMGSFHITISDYCRLSLEGPFQFIGNSTLFEVKGRLDTAKGGSFLSQGQGVTAFEVGGTLIMEDTVLRVEGKESIGIYAGDTAIVEVSDVFAEGEGTIAVYQTSRRSGLIGDGILHVNGDGAIGLWLSQQTVQLDPCNIRVNGKQAVGVVVEQRATLLPQGVYEVNGFSAIGILLLSGANTKAAYSSQWGYYSPAERCLIRVSGEGSIGIMGENQVYLEYTDITVENPSAFAAKAPGDITLVLCKIAVHENGLVTDSGQILLDTCAIQGDSSKWKKVQRKAYPIFNGYNFAWSYMYYMEYDLETYGLFVPLGYDLEAFSMPESMGFCFYDPSDPFRAPVILYGEEIVWQAPFFSANETGTFTLTYQNPAMLEFGRIEGFHSGSVPFHIFDPEFPFLGSMDSYRNQFTFQLPAELTEEETLRLWASIDDGNTWYDCTEDKMVNWQIDSFTVTELHPERNYLFRLELSGPGYTRVSNVLQYRWRPGYQRASHGGDRDGSDLSGHGELEDWLLKWLEDRPVIGGGLTPETEGETTEENTGSPTLPEDSGNGKVPGYEGADSRPTSPPTASVSGSEINKQTEIHGDRLVFTRDGMRVVIPKAALKTLKLSDKDRISVHLSHSAEGFSVSIYRNDQELTGFGGAAFEIHIPYEVTGDWQDFFCQKGEGAPIPASGYAQNRLLFQLTETGQYRLNSTAQPDGRGTLLTESKPSENRVPQSSATILPVAGWGGGVGILGLSLVWWMRRRKR